MPPTPVIANMLFSEGWLEGPLKTQFYTRLYMPPAGTQTRAALVFVHGYIEHIGRYTHFHSLLAERGIGIFAFDERGFGRTALDKEHKSPGSAYGKTGGMKERMEDMEWAIRNARAVFEQDVPLFLMGHSMGGGMVLDFATRTEGPPSQDTIHVLRGVISSSPLVRIGIQEPGPLLLRTVKLLSKIAPNFPIQTPVQDKVLSHDPNVGEESLKDQWIKPFANVQGIVDMIERGKFLQTEGYKRWPSHLPVLILHGTADQVNAFQPTKDFAENLVASDKQFIEYPGAWHDLITEPDHKDSYLEDLVSWIEKRRA